MTDEHEDRERLQISATQAVGSLLAAVSAAILCSFFGVAGTVIGTAVASLVATIGGTLYSYSLRRTRARLRRLHQAGAASPPLREVVKTMRQQGRRVFGQVPLRVLSLGAACVFVFAMGVVSAIELTAGQSLSSLFGVSHGGGHKTSLGGDFGIGPKQHPTSPKPSKSSTPTPSPSTTKSPTPTPSPSKTKRPPTPSPSPSRTPILPSLFPSATPTPTPTQSTSASASPPASP